MTAEKAGAADDEIDARLVCPVSRTPLRRDGDRLIADAAALAYPIRDGVPVLLAEAAERLPGGATAAGKDPSLS